MSPQISPPTVADVDRIAALADPIVRNLQITQCYAELAAAGAAPNPKARAELLLLANIEIGYHEQIRLQPEIAAALDAPFLDPGVLREGLLARFLPSTAWGAHLDASVDRFAARVRYLAHLVITEFMMTISFPEGKYLRLGRDLRADYPPSLVRLTNEDLLALLVQVDPTTDSIDATGAVDWGRLTDRLHFIVDMFRCYQEWPPLQQPPFTPEQAAAIKRGVRPHGEL